MVRPEPLERLRQVQPERTLKFHRARSAASEPCVGNWLLTDRLVIYEKPCPLSSDNPSVNQRPSPVPTSAAPAVPQAAASCAAPCLVSTPVASAAIATPAKEAGRAPATPAATGRATVSATKATPVAHYENFPVASLLCPPHLRQPIAAIYAFARAADDIADEGDATPAERQADLAAYRADLVAIAHGNDPSPRWAGIFMPLQAVLRSHHLPVQLLDDLLSAFVQDVEKTRKAEGYADREELLDYCRRSANPVGRLLLHLYGVTDVAALQESDAICTALQLINFWQDLSVDIPRGRYYLTQTDCAAHGAHQATLQLLDATPENRRLVIANAQWARATMQSGAPLVHRLPGRAGWELRLVVQGGLRILDKVDALQGASLHTRPRLHAWDWCVMLGRALVM